MDFCRENSMLNRNHYPLCLRVLRRDDTEVALNILEIVRHNQLLSLSLSDKNDKNNLNAFFKDCI